MKLFLRPAFFMACFIFFLSIAVKAQTPVVNLFTQQKKMPDQLSRYVAKGAVYSINETAIEQLFLTKPLALVLQFTFENKEWLIELKESELFSKSFFVSTSANSAFVYDKNEILHYKGKIKGSKNSFAAISILHHELIAVLADESGNINIGALSSTTTNAAQEHIIYREADLIAKQPFECGTAGLPLSGKNPLPQFASPVSASAVINTEPVDVYFEADYSCYANNGSNITNTVNWATALFNVVTTLYENDSVYTRMSGIKVWNTPDPYTSLTTTSSVLYAFSSNMSAGFAGDLAHLISQRGLGGGIAWLNVLCNNNYYRTGVSANLSNSFNQLPAYSWSTMVITHEMGHNIASNHTQWCGWPGGAIDNCYAVEGTCPPGPAPTNGGTIMSYCHLSIGINLANGFGPLPGAAIRNAVRTSSCIYPRISFSKNFETVTEENADIDNNCLDYTLINLKLKVNYTPLQPAVISLTAANVASPGLEIGSNKDVEISPMSFTLTDTTPQIIQLKVYNDGVIENKETLKIDYTVAPNGTNAVKAAGTYQLDILSLDHRPDSSVNQLLYYEPFDGISSGLGPWTQTVLYGAASPNRWVIGNAADAQFPTTAAYVSNNGSSAGYAGSSVADSSIIRLESPSINAFGFINLQLGYLYKCSGEGAISQGAQGETGNDYGRVYYSVNNGANWTLLKDNIFGRNFENIENIILPAAANNSTALKIAFEWLNNSSVVNNPGFIIDSIMIKGTGSSAVQTNAHAGNTDEGYLGPNQTLHFYNPATQNIMASITNKSSHDFGCTKLEIIRTGNSAAIAWGDYAAQKLTDKSYRVTATNNNAGAPYEISLYYTGAEINGWINATGNAATEMAIVKTSADITQTPPAAAATFSNYNSINNYGIAGSKIITAKFNGFSTFSIGKAGITALCPGITQQLPANETGLSYQWQVNTGSSYTSLANNAQYSGVATASLSIINAPSLWYGYKYRCMITDAQGTHSSMEYLLKFALNWMGTNNNAWENLANWGCASLPDANTDVFIKPGAGFYPVVNSNTSVRSLTLQTGAAVNVKNGVQLTILK